MIDRQDAKPAPHGAQSQRPVTVILGIGARGQPAGQFGCARVSVLHEQPGVNTRLARNQLDRVGFQAGQHLEAEPARPKVRLFQYDLGPLDS